MRRYLTITQEAAFGTYNGSGTTINFRLSGSGAFKPMQRPDFWTVMDGSGLGVNVIAGTNTCTVTGSLTAELTYTQAAFLLGWAMTRVNAGQTTPWTTAELPYDLASCTIDYARQYFDTVNYDATRYTGCKISSLSLSGSKDSPKVMIALGIVASAFSGHPYTDAATLANPTASLPALSTYPTDVTVFQHLSSGSTGFVKLNNVARSNFDSWSLSLQNKLNPYFDENRFANSIRLGGRALTANVNFRKKSTVSDFALWYPPTPLGNATQFKLNNQTNSILIDFGVNSYVSMVDEMSPVDAEHYYGVTIQNMLSSSAGTDFSFTYA
jgi:hypothetical protein